jgi:hypothetical protein
VLCAANYQGVGSKRDLGNGVGVVSAGADRDSVQLGTIDGIKAIPAGQWSCSHGVAAIYYKHRFVALAAGSGLCIIMCPLLHASSVLQG